MSDTVIKALNHLHEIHKLKPKLHKLAKQLAIAKKQAAKKTPKRAAKK